MKISSGPSQEINKINRKTFLNKIGLADVDLVLANLVHGNRVAVIDEENKGKIISECDGLVTDIPGIVLGVTAADCQALADALGPWQTADDTQRTANDLASTAIKNLRDAAAQIAAGRRDIQMAADLLWPCDKPDSGPDRLAFALPEKRPFVASNVKAPA